MDPVFQFEPALPNGVRFRAVKKYFADFLFSAGLKENFDAVLMFVKTTRSQRVQNHMNGMSTRAKGAFDEKGIAFSRRQFQQVVKVPVEI